MPWLEAPRTVLVWAVLSAALTGCALDFDLNRLPRHDGGERALDTPAVPEDADDAEAGRQCPARTTDCEGRCVALDRDVRHCGSCGHACAENEACLSGECVLQCTMEQRLCEGACRDVQRDIAHCGACGAACAVQSHSTPTCTAGRCALVCDPGHADCDLTLATGCETDLQQSADHCGRCGLRCESAPRARGVCVAGRCALECEAGFGDCDGLAANGCETDLSTDASHCGSCTSTCARPANGTTQCSAGRCQSSCLTGFADCDGLATNGCEASLTGTANCGRCGLRCEGATPYCAPMGTAVACSSGCATGLQLCAGSCVDVRSTPDHCGGCGTSCPPVPNGVRTCNASVCGMRCLTGFASCDGNALNGCEVELATSAVHCGSCGHACPAAPHATPVCSSGRCGTVCTDGYGDCNSSALDGCETYLGSDPSNCGGCGATCPAAANGRAVCTRGECSLACAPGFADCDGDLNNGCEATLANDPGNCGACGRACSSGMRCVLGSCTR
jgi:hypothetical protein